MDESRTGSGGVGEVILKSLVKLRRRLTPPPRIQDGTFEDYFKWQFETSSRLFALYPAFDVAGKDVLEIGCGTGGRTLYLASAGARRAAGIDINGGEIEIARTLSARLRPDLVMDRVEFHHSHEDAALDIGQFDLVLMVDSMEHVLSPARVLRLAHGYTKPGGKFYFGTQGWYHHRGSHTNLIPFVNVFFPDETILNVIRWDVSRPDYQPTRFDSDPPIARWQGIYDLRDRPGEYLNKITIRDVKKLVRHAPFRSGRLTVCGFSRPAMLSRLINPLRHVPILQEVAHSYLVADFVH